MKEMNYLGEVQVGGKTYKVLSKAQDWWHVVDEEGNHRLIRPPGFPQLTEEIKDTAQLRKLLTDSNVPELFIEELLSKPVKKTQALLFLVKRKDLLLSGKWAYLWGPPGTGKTFACVYFLYRYIRKYGRLGYFIFCPSHDFRDGTFKGEIKEQADIFILDDLLLELPQWQLQETILFLLETYNKPSKTVLITSNLSFTELAKGLKDERLLSRLIQKIRGCELKVEGKDLRVEVGR